MKKIFKMTVEFEIIGELTTDEFKTEMMRKISDFSMYNEDNKEVNIDTYKYWDNCIVEETIDVRPISNF